MERIRRIPIMALAAAALLASSLVFAQRGPRAPRYDVSKEKTVSGTVEAVVEVPGGRRGGGLHVTLAAGEEKWDVALGPKDFARSAGLEPAKGDAIEVTGSADPATRTIIAREVKKGDKTCRLRDEHGVPLWSRGRTR